MSHVLIHTHSFLINLSFVYKLLNKNGNGGGNLIRLNCEAAVFLVFLALGLHGSDRHD